MIGLYARVSTQEQATEPQLDVLRSYANRRGEAAREFIDHGFSGRRDQRPALDELMAAVRKREIKTVVVAKLDRLARSVRHLTNLVGELEALGADLVVTDQGIDTATPTGKLLFHVLAAIGEFERDLGSTSKQKLIYSARKPLRVLYLVLTLAILLPCAASRFVIAYHKRRDRTSLPRHLLRRIRIFATTCAPLR
jgi:DNA invertase Pin-like site-specific DNA recombinase